MYRPRRNRLQSRRKRLTCRLRRRRRSQDGQGETLLRTFEEAFGKCRENPDAKRKLKELLADYGVKILWDLPCGYYEDAMAKIRADAPIREAS